MVHMIKVADFGGYINLFGFENIILRASCHEWVRKGIDGCDCKGGLIGNGEVDSACTESVMDEDELWESVQKAI